MDSESKKEKFGDKFVKYSKIVSERYLNPAYTVNGTLIGVAISVVTMIILITFF